VARGNVGVLVGWSCIENRKNLCQEVPRTSSTSLRVYVESCISLMEKYTFT